MKTLKTIFLIWILTVGLRVVGYGAQVIDLSDDRDKSFKLEIGMANNAEYYARLREQAMIRRHIKGKDYFTVDENKRKEISTVLDKNMDIIFFNNPQTSQATGYTQSYINVSNERSVDIIELVVEVIIKDRRNKEHVLPVKLYGKNINGTVEMIGFFSTYDIKYDEQDGYTSFAPISINTIRYISVSIFRTTN